MAPVLDADPQLEVGGTSVPVAHETSPGLDDHAPQGDAGVGGVVHGPVAEIRLEVSGEKTTVLSVLSFMVLLMLNGYTYVS